MRRLGKMLMVQVLAASLVVPYAYAGHKPKVSVLIGHGAHGPKAGVTINVGKGYGYKHRSHGHGHHKPRYHAHGRHGHGHGHGHGGYHYKPKPKIYSHGHGHHGHGHGHGHYKDDSLKYLFFGLLAVGVLHALTHSQKQAHYNAQQQATHAPVGETIYWNDTGANGYVKVLRDGTSSSGRYCKQFKQVVFLDRGAEDHVTGTMCKNANGQWKVVETN